LRVGVEGEGLLDAPLVFDEWRVGFGDAVVGAPGVFVVKQNLTPSLVELLGRIGLGLHRAKSVSAWTRRSAEPRFMAVSRAEEEAPSSQYGVKSPRATGSRSPYFCSKSRNMSSVVAITRRG